MEEYFKELSRPTPRGEGEEEAVANTSIECPTGLEEMGEQLETQKKKDLEDRVKLAEFMDQETVEPSITKFKMKKSRKESPEEEEKRVTEESKGPLTTFGHSSRPRRSVNYANIERGDEAQSQSLVTNFGSTKKRPKRTRDELDENWYAIKQKKNPPKRRSQWLTTNTYMPGPSMTYELPKEEEFVQCTPSVSAEKPSEENRTVGRVLDEHVAVRRSSGGFRRFVAWLSDSMILSMMSAVDRRYLVKADTEDKKLVRTIRHVYNSMSQTYRRDWEYAAKMQIFESRIFTGGLVSMPISEILVRDENEQEPERPEGLSIRSDCCSAAPVFSDMRNVAEHFLTSHDVVHLYGCDVCHKVFTSRLELTKHDCKEFATILLEKSMKGETLELLAAYMFLCCSQCGIWMPVKSSVAGMKGWNYFATALLNHSCSTLAAVIVYFREGLPEDGKNVRMSFQFMCTVDVGFPLNCKECDTEDFGSVAEAEEHFKEKHKKQECSKCNTSFGTDFLWRHHQLSHIAQSAQFANYLTYTATYHPPANSRRHPHIGFKSEITTVGGCCADELTVVERIDGKEHEFIEATDNVMVTKLNRYKKVPPPRKAESVESDATFDGDDMSSSASDSDSSMSSSSRHAAKKPKLKEVRPDLGYEHIDRKALLSRSDSEQEAVDKLHEKLGKRLIPTGHRLLNPEDVMAILADSEVPLLDESHSKFADDIASLTVKTVNLPASNCIDPLKDLLLVNKIFTYCPACKMVLSSDPKVHCEMCGTPEEDIRELFHPASDPRSGIRCIDPECSLHLCSVTSLRNHCSLSHNVNVNLELSVPQASTDMQFSHRYDRSMMTLAKHFAELQTDPRTRMARFTDLECFMPFSGFLEPRHITDFSAPRVQPRVAHSAATEYLQIAPKTNAAAAFIKPYKIPRTSRWFSCSWCNREFEQNSEFITHLVRSHMYPCQVCGKCFANIGSKRAHVCEPNSRGDARGGNVLAGGCGVCKDRFSVELLFVHHLKRHFSSIEFDSRSGEMLPRARELRFEPFSLHQQRPNNPPIHMGAIQNERTDFRLRLIKMNTAPVFGVTLQQISCKPTPPGMFSITPPDVRNILPNLMCYMCELTYDTEEDLALHMDEAHAEQWSNCPFCEKTVSGHQQLQTHIVTTHTFRQGGRVTCEFCGEGHQRFMGSHLLYRCKRKPCCTICGQKSADAAQNYAHMRRTHAAAYKRFQCAFCNIYFVSMGEYYEHTCTLAQNRVYACVCQPDLYFSTVNQYCDHFDSIHVDGNECRVCGQTMASQEAMARHRMSHVKAEAMKTAPRQVFITEKTFFPKENSGYMRWQRGGPPPTCYRDVTLKTSAVMTNEFNKIARTAMNPRPTLFDVLEGSLSANPKSGSVVRSVTLQPANRINRPAPTSTEDVIELSDEDDDDLDVVFMSRKSGSPDGAPAGAPAGQTSQVTSRIRVEQSGGGYGGHQQPGYVVDEELEALEPNSSPQATTEPVHKEIVDENADDDLAVVAEVENATGTLPSSISSRREKKLKCTKCSEAFFTNASLQKHMEGHKQDAGAVATTETFGMPLDTVAHICRNCCTAFESPEKFRKHMAIHGDTTHSCANCAGISFNQNTIGTHMTSHANKTVFYACGTCLVKFHSDLALMAHLAKVHHVKLFYFCKICAMGSTSADAVFEHVTVHVKHPYTLMQRFTAVPLQLLNYEPADVADYQERLNSGLVETIEPSDCTHRSLLLHNDTVVSCKTCHCVQPWFSFLAFNNYSDETGFPNFRVIENDIRTPFPLTSHLNTINSQSMLRYGHSDNVCRRAGRLAHAPAGAPRAFQTGPSSLPHRQLPSQRIVPVAPIVSVTAKGARVIRPVAAPPPPNVKRVMVSAARADGSIAKGTVAMPKNSEPGQPIQLTPAIDKNRCGECNKMFTNSPADFDRHLHKMHHSSDSWLCRQCGHSEETELQLFLHYVNDHLKPAFEQQNSRQPLKANIFKLRCPISSCKDAEFMSAKTFQRHMATHPVLLPHSSDHCDARFATKQLQETHDRKHAEFLEANGTDATCCPICGTFDMWSLPKDAGTDCLQSHIIRHGLDYRSACRCCLQQFPADVHNTAVLKHILDEHTVQRNGHLRITCNICGEADIRGQDDFFQHCAKRHVFHLLLKPARSTRGELVVTTGLEFQSYVGLKASTAAVSTSPTVVRPPSRSSGNAALLTIAQAIGEVPMEVEEDEVQTIE